MKNLIAGVALCAASAAAGAASLTVNETGTETVSSAFSTSPLTAILTDLSGMSFQLGTLQASGPANVSYTYLGSQAGYTNLFTSGSGQFQNHSSATGGSETALGSILTQRINALSPTNLDFSFATVLPVGQAVLLSNLDGSSSAPQASYAIFNGAGISTSFGSFQYLLGFNDLGAGNDRDFDDLLVGVNISPIPEPETYALLLAGLAMMGFMVRRRTGD